MKGYDNIVPIDSQEAKECLNTTYMALNEIYSRELLSRRACQNFHLFIILDNTYTTPDQYVF